ncbi:MAG TPA: hypothetical protein VFT66_13315 [Roseiflexaceae bacterium]|nr:hypothetical protein [Roseiflexaceae bacterium]
MLTKSQTATAKGAAQHACSCGCAPCPKECCDLACLVRPNFFCGQLLTDADLTALVEWNRARFSLARFRHGWGVVCGLEVTCDSNNPAGVRIHPGYAVDCCGNDIVVCETGTQSLADACPKTACFDPYDARRRAWEDAQRHANGLLQRVADKTDEQQQLVQQQVDGVQKALNAGDLGRLREAVKALEDAGRKIDPHFADSEQSSAAGLFDSLLAGAQAVDLFLHYAEYGDEPQTALRRGACGAGECQDSRVREACRLSWQIVVGRNAPRSPWDAWQEQYDQRRMAAEEFARRMQEAKDSKALCTYLTDWLDNHTPGQFCFAYDWAKQICANRTKRDERAPAEREVSEAVFWLIVDDLIAWLACGCPNCDKATGIPLARVWLRGAERDQPCRIVAIDNAAPYRRPLGHDDCLPSRPGCINLGQFIGQPWAAVQSDLAAHGIVVNACESIMPNNWEALASFLRCRMIVRCNENIRVLCVDLGGMWGRRVVAFCPAGQGEHS